MKKNACKKLCKECPFKKDSMKGYLGEASGDPESFLQSMEYDPIPCHLQVDWENDTDEEIENKCFSHPCIGSLQFMNNSCKLPFSKEYRALQDSVDKNPEVFNWRAEFIRHHTIN